MIEDVKRRMWWEAYLAVLGGSMADPECSLQKAHQYAEAAAEDAVKAFEKRFGWEVPFDRSE